MIGQFGRFVVVGAIGFVVDGGVLSALIALGVDPYLGKVLSFWPALLATWTLNRTWTFARPGESAVTGSFGHYLACQLVGMMLNWCVYAGVLALIGIGPARVWFAVACGAAAGLLVNFSGARLLVFRSGKGTR